MRKSLAVLALWVGAALLIGCGSPSATVETVPSAEIGEDDHNDVWNKHFLPDGSYVECLTSDSGDSRSKIRGMSCDWVGYHLRNGDIEKAAR